MDDVEVLLKHLALVWRELDAIRTKSDLKVWSVACESISNAMQEVWQAGCFLTDLQVEKEPEKALPWVDRLRGIPRKWKAGKVAIRTIPSQEMLHEAHSLRESGRITRTEFEERIRVSRGSQTIYHEEPSLPFRTLTDLPKDPQSQSWTPPSTPGACGICGSITCNGRCFR